MSGIETVEFKVTGNISCRKHKVNPYEHKLNTIKQIKIILSKWLNQRKRQWESYLKQLKTNTE